MKKRPLRKRNVRQRDSQITPRLITMCYIHGHVRLCVMLCYVMYACLGAYEMRYLGNFDVAWMSRLCNAT